MSMTRMTLDEFLTTAPASLEAFAASTRHANAEGEEGFVGDVFERRTQVDWWREVAAYHEYTELQERLAQDRRAVPFLERRRNGRDCA